MKLKLALIQLTSGHDIAANVARIEKLVAQAAKKGAEFIALPENAVLMEASGAKRILYTQEKHPAVAALATMAKKHRVWLLAGSVSVIPSEVEGSKKDPSTPLRSAQDDKKKTYNRSLLFNPQGKIAAQYDKIHLFDVEVGDGQVYKESAKILPGEKSVVVELWGDGVMEKKTTPLLHHSTTPIRLGLSICYDVRFPHLYRALAKAGAEIIAVPAAFTKVTGEAHWHVLLRARAIENGCFIIAPAQTGTHPGKRKTFGHSLVVNPWGEIIADGGTKESVVMAEIDLSDVKKARSRIPSLQHDREFKA